MYIHDPKSVTNNKTDLYFGITVHFHSILSMGMEWRWNGLRASHLTDDCSGKTRVHLEDNNTNIQSLWACGLREVVCGDEWGGARGSIW